MIFFFQCQSKSVSILIIILLSNFLSMKYAYSFPLHYYK